jgi:hypothetical protein
MRSATLVASEPPVVVVLWRRSYDSRQSTLVQEGLCLELRYNLIL